MNFDAADFMVEATRLFLAFLMGMLTAPIFYVIHIRRSRR